MENPKDPREKDPIEDESQGSTKRSPEEVVSDTSDAITSATTVDEDRQREIIPKDNINNVRRILSSQRFLEMANAIRPHVREDLVSFATEMLMLGFDEERFWTTISEVVEKNKGESPDFTEMTLSEHTVDFIVEQAGINPNDTSDEAKREGIEYLIGKIWNKGFFYLPVNMHTAQEVKRAGKISEFTETIDGKDLQQLAEILKRKNLESLLPNTNPQTELCNSGFGTAQRAGFHPEWFYALVGGRSFIERNAGDSHHAIRSLVENDKEDENTAKWEPEEQISVIQLLEKYWKKYGENPSSVVLVPRWRKPPRMDGKIDFFRTYDEYKENWGEPLQEPYGKKTAREIMLDVYRHFIGSSTTNVDRDIKCPDTEIIQLPVFKTTEGEIGQKTLTRVKVRKA